MWSTSKVHEAGTYHPDYNALMPPEELQMMWRNAARVSGMHVLACTHRAGQERAGAESLGLPICGAVHAAPHCSLAPLVFGCSQRKRVAIVRAVVPNLSGHDVCCAQLLMHGQHKETAPQGRDVRTAAVLMGGEWGGRMRGRGGRG